MDPSPSGYPPLHRVDRYLEARRVYVFLWLRKKRVWATAFLVSGLLIFKYVVAPWGVGYSLRTFLIPPLSPAELHFKRVRVNFLSPRITLDEVKFRFQAGKATVVLAEIPSLSVAIHPLALFHKVIRLGPAPIQDLRVVVEETNAVPPSSPSSEAPSGEPSWSLEVGEMALGHGEFTYVYKKGNRSAVIGVHQIEFGTEAFGNSPALKAKKAAGRAMGLLEKSGKFDLKVTALLFGEEPDLDISLKISGQDLSDVNGYFLPANGVSLKGVLIDGQSQIRVRGNHATSAVTARYRDLAIKVNKSPETSALEAFLANIVASLTLKSNNQNEAFRTRTQTSQIQRKPKAQETVIAFVIRALTEAGLKVPSH